MGINTPQINGIKGLDRSQIKRAVSEEIFKAERDSKRNYLSGPRPHKLGVVTGNLRASVRASIIENANSITGQLSAGPLPYATIHEFGGRAGKHHRTYIRPRPYLRPPLTEAFQRLGKKLARLMSPE